MTVYYTAQTNFFHDHNPQKLILQYGSPLYVYNEDIFRARCREMTGLTDYPNFKVTYSIKANANLALLKIAREEGLHADAMSPGEIYVLEKAGFLPEEIFYISNNVSKEEMMYAIQKGIDVSVDSLSQLDLYGQLNPGGNVVIRFNPGVGIGHHEKVVTGGKKSKFGVHIEHIHQVKQLLSKYDLTLRGINQHIGSLFMQGDTYIQSVCNILDLAEQFDRIEFVDFGGGFGVPYRKQEGEPRLELDKFGKKFGDMLHAWAKRYGKTIMFRIEPGRYISAESGLLLGNVYSVKENEGITYVGTDIGFNVLARPFIYDSHHDIEQYRDGRLIEKGEKQKVTVVGNICESGDIIAKDRLLYPSKERDLIAVMDAGAYGYSMASNYNNRMRPAEVLIRSNGTVEHIRRRDTMEDLLRNFPV